MHTSQANNLSIYHPQHILYQPIYILINANIFYQSVALFTSISPSQALSIAVLAVAIDQIVAPLFAILLRPLQEAPSLGRFLGQIGEIAHYTTSFFLAKSVLSYMGHPLVGSHIRIIMFLCYLSRYVTNQIYYYMHRFQQGDINTPIIIK
jgi:hypothetical protein